VRQAERNPANISVTPLADLSSEVQISGVSGVWSIADGGSHVEYGNGQLIAVFESPSEIRQRLEIAGGAEPAYDDVTPLPELRRTTLRTRVRALYAWLKDTNTLYKLAAPNIEQAMEDTLQEHINWQKDTDTLYEGSRSVKSLNSSGSEYTYRLTVEPDGRVTYHFLRVVWGAGMSSRSTVNVGKSPYGDPRHDRSIQKKLGALMEAAQLHAARRGVAETQKHVGGVG
jgi:hypothetical protein